VLGQCPLERQCRPFRQHADVARAGPRGEVIGEAVRLVIGARDDHKRCPCRQVRTARGEVSGAGGGGHAKDARIRQMGPEGVDERGDAAVTAA
jgi:hypothetical protein